MASVVPSHVGLSYLPSSPLSLTNKFNLTASSRHPGPKLLLVLVVVGKNRYLCFIFYPVD